MDLDEAVIDSMVMEDVLLDLQEMWEGNVQSRLHHMAEEADASRFTTGICVWDLTEDTLFFQYHAQMKLKPASTQKLLTGITALTQLGADHEYKTSIYTTGQVQSAQGRRYLDGDVYVVGGFDPMLTLDDVHAVAQKIKDLGIDSIAGKIYADCAEKDTLLRFHGWTWERVRAEDEYWITPLLFNKGYSVAQYPYRGSTRQQRVQHPELYFVRIVHERLRKLGVRFSESDAYGSAQLGSNRRRMVGSVQHTMRQVLVRMMKNSDNFYAESTLLQLGNDENGQWSYEACRRAVTRQICHAGGTTDDIQVIDGSGLSHSNRVTPEAEVMLLRWAYRHDQVFQPLYATLPIAGVDGTLGSRMKERPAYNNVRAKTGTINGVSTLSGYVTAANGHLLAFSIMNNNLPSHAVGRAFQNRVCQMLAR